MQPVVMNMVVYDSPGIYEQVFSSIAGCDSIITLTITEAGFDECPNTSSGRRVLHSINRLAAMLSNSDTFQNAVKWTKDLPASSFTSVQYLVK